MLLQVLMASDTGASGADAPIVPLWRTRPPADAQYSAALADRYASDPTSVNLSAPTTASAAEAHWLDMSLDDRKSFAEQAKSSGLWQPSQGADGLAQAWANAVKLAAQYNENHPDQKSWLSPFEAVEKLSIKAMAENDNTFDAFSNTSTTVRHFTENELSSQAEAVLQRELGRNPTASELRAYTMAVNEAAKQHPQTVTESGVRSSDGSAQDVQRSVSGDSFDPSQPIEDMVRGTQEHSDYQAAAVYFPAVMQALGAVV